MALDPEIFISQQEVAPLIRILERWASASNLNTAEKRRNALINAGIDETLISDLQRYESANEFASALVAKFQTFRVSYLRTSNHPLVSLLTHLEEVYIDLLNLEADENKVFFGLLDRGRINLKILAARSAVGRIESPRWHPIGTGVLVRERTLLTCYHVLNYYIEQDEEVWVRFDYKSSKRRGVEFELDLASVLRGDKGLDYALVTIKDLPGDYPVATVETNKELNTGQRVRMIHHPQEDPIVISEEGQIKQMDWDYVLHDLSAKKGSSGAPIFNREWRIVAMHRADAITRSTDFKGLLEAIPLHAFWSQTSLQEPNQLHSRVPQIEQEPQGMFKQPEYHLASDQKSGRRVDKDVLVRHFLDEEMSPFLATIDYGKASGFVILGREEFLKHIIERMRLELEENLENYAAHRREGSPLMKTIRLYQDDLRRRTADVEVVVKKLDNCKNLVDFFVKNGDLNIILVIHNYNMLLRSLKAVMKSFWLKVNDQVLPLLKDKDRYFVVILTDDKPSEVFLRECSLKEFLLLSFPEKLEVSKLTNLARNYFRRMGLPEERITTYISRLEMHYGYLLGTYEEWMTIMGELQKG